MIKSEWLYYFTELATSNSYRIASENLHITQPTLSIAIKKMESELGVVLFERNNQGVIGLTEVGRRVLELSQHILQHFDDLQNIKQEKNDDLKKYSEYVSIYTFPAVSGGIFSEVLSGLQSLNDLKKITIKDVRYEEMMDFVTEDQYAFALAWQSANENVERLKQKGILVHRLYRAKGVVMLSKNSTLIPLDQTKCTLKDVSSLPFISYEKGYGINKRLYDLLLNKCGKPQNILEVSNIELFAQILQSGQAVGLGVNLNNWNLALNKDYTTLRFIPLKENIIFDFNVLYNRNCPERLAQQFIALLEKICIKTS